MPYVTGYSPVDVTVNIKNIITLFFLLFSDVDLWPRRNTEKGDSYQPCCHLAVKWGSLSGISWDDKTSNFFQSFFDAPSRRK